MFASVEYIMRDAPGGWLIRHLHSTGASAFFVVIYLMIGPSFTLFGVVFPIEAKVWGVVLFGLSTLIYFAFFLLLPWYTQMEQTRAVPDRVTI